MIASNPQTPDERRRKQRREDARRAILDATEVILVEYGYEKFSMRRLAERCGYAAPTIYHHFGDKAGLIDALIEERFSRLLVRLRRVRPGSDPVDLLRAQGEAYVRFSLQNPAHYRLLTAPRPADHSPPKSMEEALSALSRPLVELEKAGRLNGTCAEEAGLQLWTLLHGIISLQISRPDIEWSRSFTRSTLDILLRGLVSPAKARARRAQGRGRAEA